MYGLPAYKVVAYAVFLGTFGSGIGMGFVGGVVVPKTILGYSLYASRSSHSSRISSRTPCSRIPSPSEVAR